jgi:hypothetical protein
MKNIAYTVKGSSRAFVAVLINDANIDNFLQQNNVDCWFDILDVSKLPITMFYNAWVMKGNVIVVDLEKAKDIKRNQFRQARKPLLEKLDVEYMRAVETSNAAKKKAIATKKQELRDVTNVDMPNDVDELAKFWPDVLNGA